MKTNIQQFSIQTGEGLPVQHPGKLSKQLQRGPIAEKIKAYSTALPSWRRGRK